MSKYLAELYLARRNGRDVDGIAARAQQAAEQLSAEGTPVRYLQSIYVPEDETWFCLFDAESIEAVAAATRRADLACDRIVEAEHLTDMRPAATRQK
jgi:hypothetical protein